MKCPECDDGTMVLRSSKYGFFYGCDRFPRCRATHGAHADGSPLGIPANKETKEARIEAHAVFDQLWKQHGMKRTQAYAWMRHAMKLSSKEAHIARFTKEQCAQLKSLVEAEVARRSR